MKAIYNIKNTIQETQLSHDQLRNAFVQTHGRADLLKTRLPHICYHAELDRSALKDVGNGISINIRTTP